MGGFLIGPPSCSQLDGLKTDTHAHFSSTSQIFEPIENSNCTNPSSIFSTFESNTSLPLFSFEHANPKATPSFPTDKYLVIGSTGATSTTVPVELQRLDTREGVKVR